MSVVEIICRLRNRYGDARSAFAAPPGGGRKTLDAAIVTAFREPDGVIVYTHVKRIAQPLGMTEQNLCARRGAET